MRHLPGELDQRPAKNCCDGIGEVIRDGLPRVAGDEPVGGGSRGLRLQRASEVDDLGVHGASIVNIGGQARTARPRRDRAALPHRHAASVAGERSARLEADLDAALEGLVVGDRLRCSRSAHPWPRRSCVPWARRPFRARAPPSRRVPATGVRLSASSPRESANPETRTRTSLRSATSAPSLAMRARSLSRTPVCAGAELHGGSDLARLVLDRSRACEFSVSNLAREQRGFGLARPPAPHSSCGCARP